MKTEIITGNDRGTYLRVNRIVAQKIFEEGNGRLYVMTSDRNPVTSLTTAHEYKKGCKPYCYYYGSVRETINTFDELLDDFAYWLDTDGYGHNPDRYRSMHEMFSYWVKIEN